MRQEGQGDRGLGYKGRSSRKGNEKKKYRGGNAMVATRVTFKIKIENELRTESTVKG